MKMLILALVAALAPAPSRPIQVDDVVQVRQIPETRISPDGKHVAFVVTEPSVADNKTTSRLMVGTRTVAVADRIANISWSPDGITFLAALDGADEVWSVPVSGGKPRKLFNSPAAAVPIGGQRLAFRTATTPPHDAKVLRHEWSHDGRKLAFVVPQLMAPSTLVYDEKTMGVQSLTTGQYGTARAGIWVYEKSGPRHVFDLDLGAQGGLGPVVTWSPDDTRLELNFNRKTTVVDARSGQVLSAPPTEPPPPPQLTSPDAFSAWSFGGGRAAAVRENSSTPPRVVVIDGQDIRDVYNPNASVPPVLGSVPAQWTDVHGHKAGGFKIVPPGCHRCPAIVITHGWDALSNRFMSDGFEWQYPSQVFAAKGYVVLGVAETRDVPPDGLDAVAMMEAAVKSGVDDGTIDPARVGIAGYSRGAEVTQLAVSHSNVFKVASSGEGGNGTVGYWLLGAQNPYAAEQAKEVFGGSPVDPAAVDKWRAFAADLRAEKINTPLLMQGAENNSIANLELRAYIRARDVPAELTIFPNETHLFHKPADRATAMSQNLDWFDYWLNDRRDPDPAKKPQYTRWDAMRAAWHRN